MAQMGVGGIDSWTKLAYPMDAYRLSGNEPHAYKVRLLPVARGAVKPATPGPRDWNDPATGYRVVRLSEEAGSTSFYFHQNAYTATGDKIVIEVPDGLATVDLNTRASPIAGQAVVAPKSRQVLLCEGRHRLRNAPGYESDARRGEGRAPAIPVQASR